MIILRRPLPAPLRVVEMLSPSATMLPPLVVPQPELFGPRACLS